MSTYATAGFWIIRVAAIPGRRNDTEPSAGYRPLHLEQGTALW